MVMGDNRIEDYKKYREIAGHFDDRSGATVQYRAHHPMEEVHGFYKSH